jgi:3'-5' exonuclease
MISTLKEILFIDIETVSAKAEFDEMDERLQKLWIKKANFFKQEEKEPAELYKDKAAIYSEFGQIVCIGMGFLREKDGEFVLRLGELSGKDEKDLLEKFAKLLDEQFPKNQPRLCAHNGFEFDFPYICRRMRVHGIPLPSSLALLINAKPWTNPHIDTMEMWKFGDRKHFTSLDLMATIFDVETSKSDIDGSMVSNVYHVEDDLPRITRYCIRDVEVLTRVYLKLAGLDLEISSVEYPDSYFEETDQNPPADLA